MSRVQDCENGESAALYALGLLNADEARTFEQHLSSCSSCAEEVRESGELAIQLAATIPHATPPASLRKRVLAEAVLPRGVVALVRREGLHWQETPFEGVMVALLYEDPLHGELASLVRMSPGAHYPSHHHASLEHCYVIEGDLIFEDHSLTAGDYSAGTPDDDHSAATTKNGCLLFIVHNLQDQVHTH